MAMCQQISYCTSNFWDERLPVIEWLRLLYALVQVYWQCFA